MHQTTHRYPLRKMVVSVIVALGICWFGLVNAAPVGGDVAAGSANINQAGTTTTINQTTQNVVINWQEFNTASNEAVNFIQPNANAAALNRINSGLPTQFFGTLTANGHIFIVNPAGVFFGASSRIDVGGILATTADIQNQNFMNGHYQFQQAPGSFNSVVNEGEIYANGFVGLVAPGVMNNGVIHATFGKVVLASGTSYIIDMYGDQLIQFGTGSKILQAPIGPDGKPMKHAVSNNGSIYADGGKVLLTANAASDILDSVIDTRGYIQAVKASVDGNGSVILSGGDEGIVTVSGKIKSGTVKVLGDKVGLMDGAVIDASGVGGGGEVLIGGNYQGQGPEQNASAVYMSPTAIINADAIDYGNGGKVILWSNDYTGFYGNISAQGGALGGNGGFVETSSHDNLQAFGLVNASAANGLAGTWLLDPRNVTISSSATSNGAFNGGSPTNTFTPTGNNAVVNVTTLNTALGSTNVTINTGSTGAQAGTITVSNAIAKTTGANTALLTLTAASNIILNAGISVSSGVLNITLSSGGTITQAVGAIISGTTLTTSSVGGTTLTRANTVSNFNATNITSGNISFTNSGALNITGIAQSVGNLTIANTGAITQSGAMTVSGTSSFTAGANPITLTTATNSLTGAITFSNSGSNAVQLTNNRATSLAASTVGQNLTITSVGAITQTGALVVPGTSSFTAGANAITLGSANSFTGAITLSNSGANNVSLTNSLATILAASTIGQNLTLISGGAITESGVLTIPGTTSLRVNAAGSDILLNTQANNLTGAVSFAGTLGNIRDFALRNINASASVPTLSTLTSLRNLTLQFDNAAIALPAATLHAAGNASITAGGAITQSGVLTVPGTSLFSAGANAITLGSANVLTGAITLSNSGANNISLTNSIATVLAASTVGNNLTINSTGAITQTGALTVPGSTTLVAGTANNITLGGANNFNSLGITSANNVVINDINAIALNAITANGSLTLTAGAGITVNGVITTGAAGDSLVLSGTTFTNTAGASALSPGTGRFLVWSGNPASDNRGGIVYNFKQYNATYGVSTVLGTGNGFLYTLAPTITANLTGTASRSYNATTTTSSLLSNILSTSGAVDSDSIVINTLSGIFATKNVGTNININSVSGTLSATNGSATVYGYQLNTTPGGTTNIGTITAAPITISSNSGQTKVYGSNDPAGAATAYSLTAGSIFTDSLTGSMGRAVGETVGNYNFTQNTVTVNDGNGGNNYAITFNGATNPFVITAKSLTGSIVNQSKIYGADDPTLSGIAVTLNGKVNAIVTDINGNNTVINDTSNVAATLASLTRAAGETVASYNITAGTFNALTGSAAGNYSAPTFSGAPTLTINKANLTGSIANQSKTYGANDPTLSGIGVTLNFINRTVSTWNGNVSVNDAGLVATTLASLTRAVGETVASYNITAATFNALTGTSAGNYNAPSFTGSPTLTINKANLTGSIANQTKTYGANDPLLSGISVTLGGIINNPAIVTWNGNVSVNDTGLVATTLASLTRAVGEAVASYNITAATFNALTGTSAGNYNAPSFTGTPTLTINKANLTGSIANQTKTYGANDPLLSGISVTLGGVINNPAIVTWNGNVSVNDTGLVATTLASLTRAIGESVASYNITAATFNALTGTSAGNYNAPSFTGSPTLTINKANLTGSIANQTKTYGANDPLLSGISVTLGGVINNPAIVTWNGNVSVNDTGLVATTLASLTRAVGETVASYNITAATFTVLTGSAAGNYNAPSFTGSPTLTINKANLTGTIANQSKIYGADDPTLSGISVTLGGIINNPAIVTWNGNVSINDTGNVATTLASLTRAVGEIVASYNITAATFTALTGSAAGNYNAPVFGGAPTLAITQKALTGSIANQSKVYGADDPLLSGISVSLSGIVNRSITDWNSNSTPINDNGNVSATLASLIRDAGENVASYNITGSTLNYSGSAASNYSTSASLTGGPILTINKANLVGTIANQSKVYGADDPSLSGIGVTLGVINNPAIVTWNGNVSVNDTGNVATTLASLTRAVGEAVASYNITAATFNTLTGTSAGNYNAPSFTGSPTLTINKANLTGSIVNQSKIYGTNDPLLSGISVTLGGVINNSAIVTWNGNVSVNDTGNVATTLASLTRAIGETVASYNITAATFNALTGSAAGNYNVPSFSGSPTLAINKANLTGSIVNQSKIYGANDPTLSGISVTLGVINNPAIVTWNGNVSVNDTGNVAATLASLTRAVGETVASYNITAATFNALTGTSAGNYNAPSFTGSPTLTINKANLTGTIANQSKIYGADDPALSGISVNLDFINRTVATWNGDVSVNDTGNVATTLFSLTRDPGELVASYNITAASFNALTGSAAGNYNAPVFGGSPTLAITQKALTGSIADQNKIYGADDPSLASITVNLSGIVNRSIVDWNDNSTPINDNGNVSATLASLIRDAGENVASYNITGSTLNYSGSAASNYSTSASLTGSPILTINKANLTGSIANQSKIYGANDPSLSGISVNLNFINRTVATWNGNVSVNDTGNVATTLASLTRAVGEAVASYNITAATFNALTGTSAGNYNAPSFSGSPTLTINKANLTGSITNQNKVYGANDPLLSGISVTLGGIINNPAIVTWNGNVSVNDTGSVATTLASLTRAVGEDVASYNITAATFNALTGSSAGNYNAPSFTGSPTLTISKANLTGSITNQNKVYGADDALLSGISVTLGGIINNPAIVTWNGNVSVNDTGLVATTLASLTRAVGESVASYNITAATFNSLTGIAAGNYNAPSFSGSPTLIINKANLTGSIANQTKVYGADDPALSGIGVTLNFINRTVSTWNGNVSVDDTGNVATTLFSLTRDPGELVASYNITAASFNALTGSAASNYNAPVFGGSPTLAITQKALTGSILNQSKVYGADDPSLASVTVNLSGIVNRSITDWNGNVTPINDNGNVSATLASLIRDAGENVASYNITGSTLNYSGSAASNYSTSASLTGSPILTINKANLTGSIANQSKIYGANDPSLSGISVNLNFINRTVATWNGNVSVNDTGNVATTLASLTRAVGEAVASYNITAATFTVLTGSAAGNYNAPSFTGSPTLTINKANLTGTIANQSKIYGADDPTLSGISVTLGGIINNPAIVTWNGNVSVNDTGNVATTLASLTRVVGETVASYNITAATFTVLTGSAAGNYNASSFTGSPTLTINKANLTGSIANQSKTYGADDPSLSGISVTLGGIINNPAIVTWNGNVSVDDTGNVATTLASLTRAVSETVASYNITAATFNALTGTAAGNYNAPSFTGSPILTINKANLTGSIANQTKVYGADDPLLSGISVTLGGIINNPAIVTWNGNVSVNDTGSVATTLASLTRAIGEDVASYNITAATFNSLAGSAAGNYNAPSFSGSPTLTINPANLTGSIANQNKIYGADDPLLSGIAVNLGGIINNPSVSTWNGVVSINDTGLVATTLASLTRAVGETVASYNITAATFNALTGTSAGNYNAPSFSGSPTLTINKANLTGSIANQNKVYGANDPLLSGISVTLGGIINNPAIVTWNGNVSVNDTGLVATTLASLTRAVGENVASYNITAASFNALTGGASSNYNAPSFSGSPTLTINPANLTGSIANQNKIYGADDPLLSGISVTLGGIINNPSISTWNGVVSIDDTGNVGTTLASLTRAVGEDVTSYNITAATFNALTGSSAGNYNAPSFAGSPTLTINKANLTGSIANQTKTYGANDPGLSGISVALNGIINRTVSTWNGNVGVNDVGNVNTALASLSRAVGESINSYNINSATFTALTGSAANNYNMTTLNAGSTLAITKASLSATIANQSKNYGASDPLIATIPVILNGVINNPAVVTWNGNVNINDTGLVHISLASLTRALGETVSGGPYSYTSVTYQLLGGSAAGNYNQPANNLSTSPALNILPLNLSYVANAVNVLMGNPIPALSGTVTGFIPGDNIANATTGTLMFTTAATSGSPAGSYAINGSGLIANFNNYNFIQAPGNATALTIQSGVPPVPPVPPVNPAQVADILTIWQGSSGTNEGTDTSYSINPNYAFDHLATTSHDKSLTSVCVGSGDQQRCASVGS